MEFSELIKVSRIEGVTVYQDSFILEGLLCLTGHYLMISSKQNESRLIMLKNVDCTERKAATKGGVIVLKCKDFTVIQIDIPDFESCQQLAASIEALSNIENINLLLPFYFKPSYDILENGWLAFSPESECSRLRMNADEWRLSTVNKEYKVTPSYSRIVIVPKSVDDETIVKAAQFRHHSRFPVMCYYHKDKGTSLLRSSQPLVGPTSKRCKEDERLLNAALDGGKRGVIVDLRSVQAVKVDVSRGGGTETDAHYSQWKRMHTPIEPTNILRNSLVKLLEAFSSEKWLLKLDSSGWLSHVKDVLSCACTVASHMTGGSHVTGDTHVPGASVLVHDAEGLDSTLQVTSLVQLILNPDCRTLRGFEALVEREWLHAGHNFSLRCARSAYAMSQQRQESPVFLLFLDCTWQLLRQFPLSFEFGEELLLLLLKHSYASEYGTFLCSSERERLLHSVDQKTVSLWSYVNHIDVLPTLLNPMYEPCNSPLWPCTAPQALQCWLSAYNPQPAASVLRGELRRFLTQMSQNHKDIQSTAVKLRKQVVKLHLESSANDTGAL